MAAHLAQPAAPLWVLFGIVLLLQLIWQSWRGQASPAPPLQGPELNLTEVVLIIAGGFVVLGGVLTPLLALPALGGLLAPLGLSPALRAATEVLLLYTLSALPAWWFLRSCCAASAGEARWLQWRPSWLNWPQAGRGLLMSLPIVALSGWLVERLWPNAGGSNPLLEEVLNGRSNWLCCCWLSPPQFWHRCLRSCCFAGCSCRWLAPAGVLPPALALSALVFALAHLSLRGTCWPGSWAWLVALEYWPPAEHGGDARSLERAHLLQPGAAGQLNLAGPKSRWFTSALRPGAFDGGCSLPDRRRVSGSRRSQVAQRKVQRQSAP